MIAVMLHKPNVWLEFHGWSPKYIPSIPAPRFRGASAQEVMFGADYPLFTYERLVADWRALGFDDTTLRRVFVDNAAPGSSPPSPAADHGSGPSGQGRDRGGGAEPGHRLRDRRGSSPPKALGWRWSRDVAEPLDAAVARCAEGGGRAMAIAARHPQAGDPRAHRRIRARDVRPARRPRQQRRRASLGMLDTFDDAAWAKAIEQNLMSVVRLTRHAIPHLRAAGGGAIVNIAALSVLQPMATFGLSVATWAGVLGYAKTLSLEVAADRITVNTLCPGRIATARLEKVFGTGAGGAALDDGARADMAKQVPRSGASARRTRSRASSRSSPRRGAGTSRGRCSTSTAGGVRRSLDRHAGRT